MPGASTPALDAADLARVLSDTLGHPTVPSAFARWLAALPALEALAPGDAKAWLARFERVPDAPLMAARAAFEGLAYQDAEAQAATIGRLAFASDWLAVAARDPDGDVLARHRELVAAASAAVGTAFDADDPERVWEAADAPAGGPVRGLGAAGALMLDPLVARGAATVVHLVTRVSVAAETRATLRLGAAADAVVVSVDAQATGIARFVSGAVMDQLEVPVVLAPGEHVILVTLLPSAREALAFRARWTDARAAPAAALAAGTAASGAAVTWALSAAARPSPAGKAGAGEPTILARHPIAAALEAEKAPLWAPLAARLLGLADRTEGGDLEHALTTEAERGPGASGLDGATFVLALGGVARDDLRLSLLASWLAAASQAGSRSARAPASAVAVAAALAQQVARRGQLVRAAGLLEADAGAGTSELRAWVQAELTRYEGEPERGFLGLAGMPSERARRLRAELALAIGRADQAAEILAQLAAETPGRLDTLSALGRARVASGDAAGGLAIAERLAALRPDRVGYALDVIEKRLQGGDAAGAEARLAALLPALRWKADAQVAAGRLYEALGQKEAAAARYARALTLEPANEEARRRAERLAGAQPLPLPTFDPPSLERMAALPTIDRRAAFEVLDETLRIEVAADGSATRWVRRVLRTQNVPDAREARTLTLKFDPSREDLRVVSASIIRRDVAGGAGGAGGAAGGWRAIPVAERVLRSASESWYGLYYDVRELRVAFDGLQVGDLLEITTRSDAIGNIFPGLFELVHVLFAPIPTHALHITVEAPTALGLRERLTVSEADRARVATRHTLLPGAAPTAPGRERWSLEATNLAALAREPSQPGPSEIAPVWQLTTFATWEALGAWYRRLLLEQRVVTTQMRAFLEAAKKAATQRDGTVSESELILAIARYVTRDIRYVGLEFGIHGYKPYRTDQIWARRFGDCKDKALLLATLFEEVGIPAEVALVRTRATGRIGLAADGPSPSLALFDHAIVFLPSRGLYVDPTATNHVVGELPREDQGAQTLRVPLGAGGPNAAGNAPADPVAHFALTPIDAATRNGIVGVYSVALTPSGAGQIQAAVQFQGLRAPFYRALFADPSRQQTALEQVLNGRYPGLKLESFRPGISEAEAADPGAAPIGARSAGPVELVFHASVPALASVNGGALMVPHPAGLEGVVDAVTGLEARHTPLVLGPPAVWDLTFRYELPAHYKAAELPRTDGGEGPFGRWHVAWTEEAGAVVVRAELAWASDQIAPADYPAFRQFARTIDAALPDTLVLEREAP